MAKLTIVSVAYPFSPVSPDAVGGAEQIIAALDHAIARAGARSIVVASESSSVRGELVPVPAPPDVLDPVAVGEAHAAVSVALATVLGRERVDVVHMHGIDFQRYLPPPGPPMLATLHLPPSWYPREALASPRPRSYLCCVSEAQREALPPCVADAYVIENGVDLDAFWSRSTKARFCLMLARVCPEKGIHEALDAATQAGVPLVIGGEISRWEPHQRYFADRVQPRLRPPHRFLGPVGIARKARLLAAARALLVPSTVEETSSLVAMEALASGTPVIAYAKGALPRIVDHGVTGYLVRDVQGMARAIADVDRIEGDACRRAAERRFSAATMTARYLALYERLARGGSERTRPGAGEAGRGEARRARAALVSDPVEPSMRGRSSTTHVPRDARIEVGAARGLAALEALSGEWTALFARSATASPFQSPGWLLAYVRAFCAGGAEPWALVARRGAELVALAPLCTRADEATGRRTTSLLGDGVSDYLDIVTAPEAAAESTAAVVEALARHCHEARSVVILDELRDCSPLASFPAPAGVREEWFRREPCPAIRLTEEGDPLPRPMRDKIRYYQRRAERIGPVTIEQAAPESALDWLATLFALHGARWKARGEDGVLASEAVRRFQRDAVVAMTASGLARLYALRVGRRPGAVMLVLLGARTAHYYIGGFDPELESASPGTLLIGGVIDRLHAEGLAEFDFLRGSEPYKYRFGARDRFNRGRRLEAETTAS